MTKNPPTTATAALPVPVVVRDVPRTEYEPAYASSLRVVGPVDLGRIERGYGRRVVFESLDHDQAPIAMGPCANLDVQGMAITPGTHP